MTATKDNVIAVAKLSTLKHTKDNDGNLYPGFGHTYEYKLYNLYLYHGENKLHVDEILVYFVMDAAA